MKTSINQTKITVDSIVSRRNQAEGKMSEIDEILYSENHKRKKECL
jgi:hypothetical protein